MSSNRNARTSLKKQNESSAVADPKPIWRRKHPTLSAVLEVYPITLVDGAISHFIVLADGLPIDTLPHKREEAAISYMEREWSAKVPVASRR